MLNVWNKNPINSIQASFSFLYTLKTSENLWFADVFRGYRNGIFASNRLMCCVLCLNHWWPIKTTENNVTLNWNLPAGKIEICRITKKLELLHVFAKLLYFSHSVAGICLLSSEFPFWILRAVIFKPHTHLNFWITLHDVNVSCKWMGYNEPELLKWYDGFSYRWAISSSKIALTKIYTTKFRTSWLLWTIPFVRTHWLIKISISGCRRLKETLLCSGNVIPTDVLKLTAKEA